VSDRTPNGSESLLELVDGYRVTQALYAAVTLRIPDLLASRPQSSDELATTTGTHPDALERLLRALAATGVLHQDDDRRFSLTSFGDPLRSDSPESIAGWVAYVGREPHWRAWGDLLHSVRTGENAFRHVYGTDVWEYRAEHTEESAIFDGAMAALTSRDNRDLIDAFAFDRFETIVDVGGGNGSLLAAVLAATPNARGAVFDLPHVVASAAAVLETAGVAERCETVAGSFFDGVPPADAYVLRSILHDWEDEGATAILTTCTHSLKPRGSVLVVERLIGAPNEDRAPKYSDLNMLVGVGGRERTLEEFSALFEGAGLELASTTKTGTNRWILEARR
jgi:hypothetical protein